jgi:hypothetical protein
MGSLLSKANNGNDSHVNNDHRDILIECSSEIASPSSTMNYHLRQPSIRSRNVQPMPHISELDRRFAKVLVSVDFISC